jgi:hypothetical protein
MFDPLLCFLRPTRVGAGGSHFFFSGYTQLGNSSSQKHFTLFLSSPFLSPGFPGAPPKPLGAFPIAKMLSRRRVTPTKITEQRQHPSHLFICTVRSLRYAPLRTIDCFFSTFFLLNLLLFMREIAAAAQRQRRELLQANYSKTDSSIFFHQCLLQDHIRFGFRVSLIVTQ